MSTAPLEHTDLSVDDLLCLALHRAARAMTAHYRPGLAALDLTYPQHLVLSLLGQEGGAGVGSLGARLGLESSTLSPLLRRLEARGLVTRTRGDDDERRVVVELTDAGRELHRRTCDLPARVSRATGMTRAEQTALVAQLRRLVTALEDG